MKKIFLAVFAIALISPVMAQDNVFLDKEFWNTKPDVATIDLKIKEGNDISEANSSNFDGVTQAILQDAPNASIEYAISKKGNDVNKLTHDGRTYIFWAAYRGNVELVQFLLDIGAKTDITDDKGSSILNFAAGAGQDNTKVYDLLLAHGADLQKDLTPYGANALLLIAPHAKDFSLINYFNSKGLDLKSTDTNGNGIFNYAAKAGNIPLMTQLLEKGIKGNDQAFIFASQGGRGISNGIEVYQFLESKGLNPVYVSKTGETALHNLASRSKDMAVINYFLEKEADVNQQDAGGNTPFMNAAATNNLETVKAFSKTVKNRNVTNKKGESALTLAVAKNSPEVVAFLLDQNADASVVDKDGNDLTFYLMQFYTAKNAAAFDQKLTLLENKGFKFGKVQKNGNTLYHLALDKNDVETLQFIKKFNADVNAKNKEGIAPLHKAAMKAENTKILTYLVSVGADKEVTTDFDESAFDLASENELLQRQHASLDFLK